MKIGIIGCGNISSIYFKNLTSGIWPQLDLIACADLDLERAKKSADAFSRVQVMDVQDLIASTEVELVVNLTIPQAHYPIALQVIHAGKHHYSEKPMALCAKESKHLLVEALKSGVQIGCAPDTFLGAGLQTAIDAIQSGKIGQVVSVTGQMICRGHEGWHPNPEFYYQKGGGPLLDMGPYYLTAMVAMFGKIKNVKAFNRKTFEQRTITSQAKNGTIIPVEIPTHTTSLLEFESGVIGTIVTSFDAHPNPSMPKISVHGTKGALEVPDPNTFGGKVLLIDENKETKTLNLVNSFDENSRGLGVSDMVNSIEKGVLHQASGELASHILEVMEKILSEDE